jgi:anti-sigma-K factor RskA
VEQARWVVANLTYAAPQVDPPAQLRSRILDAARADLATHAPVAWPEKSQQKSPAKSPAPAAPRSFIPVWAWTAAAALLLFAGYTTWQMRQIARDAAALERTAAQERQRSAALLSERDRYQQALSIVADATTRQLQLKPAQAAMPPVTAYWNEKLGLVLASGKMPEMPAGRTLQLWVVPKTGSPISAGVFRPSAAGEVLMVMPAPQSMSMAKALAISEEPAGGSPQPTSTPGWVGPVS